MINEAGIGTYTGMNIGFYPGPIFSIQVEAGEGKIMNKRDTVQTLLAALQQGDLEQAGTLLAEQFRFNGRNSAPLNAKAWLARCASLKAAFPDLDYRFHIVDSYGDVVVLTAQWSGTHTGDLDLTDAIDLGVIPATYKSFAAGLQTSEITVGQDGISTWAEKPTESAGLLAILQQLDVYIADVMVPRSTR
jgi:predicted ester cyclase